MNELFVCLSCDLSKLTLPLSSSQVVFNLAFDSSDSFFNL